MHFRNLSLKRSNTDIKDWLLFKHHPTPVFFFPFRRLIVGNMRKEMVAGKNSFMQQSAVSLCTKLVMNCHINIAQLLKLT